MLHGRSHCWSDELRYLYCWSTLHLSGWLHQPVGAIHVRFHALEPAPAHYPAQPYWATFWFTRLAEPVSCKYLNLPQCRSRFLRNFSNSITARLAKWRCTPFSLRSTRKMKKKAAESDDCHILDPSPSRHPLRHHVQPHPYHLIKATLRMR